MHPAHMPTIHQFIHMVPGYEIKPQKLGPVLSDFRMTLKNGFGIKVVVICFISQWMKRSKHRLFVFPPRKPASYGEGIVRLANRVAV